MREVFISHPDLAVGGRETFEAESCRWKRWWLFPPNCSDVSWSGALVSGPQASG